MHIPRFSYDDSTVHSTIFFNFLPDEGKTRADLVDVRSRWLHPPRALQQVREAP